MLVTFKSPAGADIMMFDKNAKQILDLFGKDVKKGVIIAEETEAAIARLEGEIERRKLIEAAEKARIEKEKKEKKEKEKDEPSTGKIKPIPPAPEPPVSFSARAYPFLQLLKAAHKMKKHIYWGV